MKIVLEIIYNHRHSDFADEKYDEEIETYFPHLYVIMTASRFYTILRSVGTAFTVEQTTLLDRLKAETKILDYCIGEVV